MAFAHNWLFVIDPLSGEIWNKHNFMFPMQGPKQMVMYRDAHGNEHVIANSENYQDIRIYPEIDSAVEPVEPITYFVSKIDSMANSIVGQRLTIKGESHSTEDAWKLKLKENECIYRVQGQAVHEGHF